MVCFLTAIASFLLAAPNGSAETNDLSTRIQDLEQVVAHVDAKLTRQLNELLWRQRLGDIASIEKVRFTGPPPKGTNNLPSPPGSNNVIVSAMTFLPKAKTRGKLPLIVLAHSEIHGNVASDEDANVIRELAEQGYAVIAPDYRGSSGYGPDYWKLIDYGGLETEDV